MTPNFALRPARDSEQPQALGLWQTVFGETAGFFERYYRADADPHYREGDTLGAWAGDRLVSAVHLCRRPVVWAGRTLLCGGIANVATLPEFRRQGLSRRLLEMAIVQMEREGFHYSLLGTGVPGHYAALGWEQTHGQSAEVRLQGDVVGAAADWRQVTETGGLAEAYAAAPRPLQFVRSPAYWEGWVGWNWRRWSSLLCDLPGRGYLILVVPPEENGLIFTPEWRAVDAEAERLLLLAAVAEVRRRGRDRLGLETMPQHLDKTFLDTLGEVATHTSTGSMARNIGLPDEDFPQIIDAYRNGEAIWWSGDGF